MRSCQLAFHALFGVLGCALLAASTGCGGSQADTTGPARPNILFVLIDTQRADRLGAYRGAGKLTPAIDALARDGVLFERAIAPAPWTLPAVASLFTGVHPSVHKANRYQGESISFLDDEFETLAERLRAGGYDTAAFVANPYLTRKWGLTQGFNKVDARFVSNVTNGGQLNTAALQWLGNRESIRPFFLYLHYMDVHAPYTSDSRFVQRQVERVAKRPQRTPIPAAEFENHPGYFRKSRAPFEQNPAHRPLFGYREYWQARYDAGVAQTDFFLGKLRAELERIGLWDETYVIITADHGEALGEHGLWTHGLSAHQDQLHVPMILRWPGKLPRGKRISETVRLFDLMPTLLEQLGLEHEENFQAASLVPLLEGKAYTPRPAFSEAVKENPQQTALVDGKWKLLVDPQAGTVELFDLDADPRETTNVAQQHADVVAGLRALLDHITAENTERAKRSKGGLRKTTPQERETLLQLGYTGEAEASDGEAQETPSAVSPGGP